jgi:hypothetical protein
MSHWIRRAVVLVSLAVFAACAFALPAGAQQLVDAGKEGDGSGGLAFVLFALMVFLCGGAMFFMDHVRRRRLQQEEDANR